MEAKSDVKRNNSEDGSKEVISIEGVTLTTLYEPMKSNIIFMVLGRRI